MTPSLMRSLFPACRNPDTYAVALAAMFQTRQINTRQRRAAFLSQTGHETGGYTVFVENLNYSADALMRVFRRHFPDIATATSYARQPRRIANRAYANRMGNGPEASGDGWAFRGRGTIQLTGRDNYTRFGRAMGFFFPDGKTVKMDDVLTFIETPQGSVEAGGWFWTTNNLNALADRGDVVAVTRVINGGENGLADRQARYAAAMRALA